MIANSKLRNAMRKIASNKGDFTLFALFMRSDNPGKWDLVVSAPWLEKGQLKATSELVGLLSDSIGDEALHEFSRIATVGRDNPAVKFILENLPVDDGERRVRSTDLFGFQLDEAIIFRAKKPQVGRNGPSNRALHPPAAGRG